MRSILLVEDNADMLMMLRDTLELGGFRVLTGKTGRDGLKLLTDSDPLPDLVISDIAMPDMSGLDFLEAVRKRPEWDDIPFIMMSGHVSRQDHKNAMEHGANAYLVKPFSLQALNEILARWGMAFTP